MGVHPFGGNYGHSIVELDDVYISVNTSIISESTHEIVIYPNPVKDVLNIKNTMDTTKKYRIIDSFGQLKSPFFFDSQRVVKELVPGRYYLLVNEMQVIPFDKL